MSRLTFPQDYQPDPDHFYKGFRMLALSPAATLDAIREMEVRDDDIWVVTYPKAGTTLGAEMTSVIVEGGDLEKMESRHSRDRVIFLETGPIEKLNMPARYKFAEAMPRDVPRLFRTHLSYELMPEQWYTKKPKTLYIARNPKDTAVSSWHFTKINRFLQPCDTFEEFLPKFVEGDVMYGSWFDHNLAYWEHRNDTNILFVTFEDTVKDLKGQITRIADFYGRPLPAQKVDACVEYCTFHKMKENPMIRYSRAAIDGDKGSFFRKGMVGDWKNHFTVAQSEMFDSIYTEKMTGTGLTFAFDTA
ncbi:sulfotransferase 1C2-like [Ptychodera flava]|uniref:sulfotransferase 1C2-like n=1 Tax=Ptychodera flava TaxID=63121 RepID=UPI00396A10C6